MAILKNRNAICLVNLKSLKMKIQMHHASISLYWRHLVVQCLIFTTTCFSQLRPSSGGIYELNCVVSNNVLRFI
jgi:hypothetical protein